MVLSARDFPLPAEPQSQDRSLGSRRDLPVLATCLYVRATSVTLQHAIREGSLCGVQITQGEIAEHGLFVDLRPATLDLQCTIGRGELLLHFRPVKPQIDHFARPADGSPFGRSIPASLVH